MVTISVTNEIISRPLDSLGKKMSNYTTPKCTITSHLVFCPNGSELLLQLRSAKVKHIQNHRKLDIFKYLGIQCFPLFVEKPKTIWNINMQLNLML